MKIYENDIDIESMGHVKYGFLTALVDDAEATFKDSDNESRSFSEEEYKALCDNSFAVENISEEAVVKCVALVDEFFNGYLNDGQKRKINGMTREEQIGFGIDLYQSMLYDNDIMGEEFRPAIAKFHPVDASASIGESVDGGIRIFFE